jgi:hypothetical protein
LPAKVRDAERRCPRERAGLSTFGPHAIGTERSATVSSGTSFAQVTSSILGKRARVQNPDKDEVPGSKLLLAELRATSRLDLARAIADSYHCRGLAVR